MATSIITHRERQRQRLATATRQAALNATAEERVQLDRLARLVALGHVTVPDALETVADLRRRQGQRAVSLRVLTMPPTPPTAPPTCAGTHTCPCSDCDADRAKRRPLGDGPAQLRPRPSRYSTRHAA